MIIFHIYKYNFFNRVLMKCLYIGNFDMHHTTKKRRLIGPTKENAMSNIINKRIACETFREKEAHRLMKIGKLL